MKKAMYSIEFDMGESAMSGRIEISKAEFEKQLSLLKKQIVATAESEFAVEELPYSSYETASTYETTYLFSCGCATTYLRKTECKEGFCIKPKKDR